MNSHDHTRPKETNEKFAQKKNSTEKSENQKVRVEKKDTIIMADHILDQLGLEPHLIEVLGPVTLNRNVDDEGNPVLIIEYESVRPPKMQKQIIITYDRVLQLYWVEFGVIRENQFRRTESYVGVYLKRWKDLIVDEKSDSTSSN